MTFLNCPYCGKEMERGVIQSQNELNWIKGEKRRFFGKASFYEDSVVLSEFSLLKNSAVIAHRCPDCQKIVIDYSDKTTDLNSTD